MKKKKETSRQQDQETHEQTDVADPDLKKRKLSKEETFTDHLRNLQLSGLGPDTTKDELKDWVEEQLPGGCGIESVRRILGKPGHFTISFWKDHNAKRALQELNGAEMNGYTVSATLRALELSRQSSKAGRLIVRNLSFNANQKHLRKAFEVIGSVADIHLPMKEGSNLHRGFAFIQYEQTADAERAVSELNNKRICGRVVAVDWAVDASVYSSLQREERREPKESRLPKPKPAKKGKADVEATEAKEEDVPEDLAPDAELKRMKELLGDEIEEEDDEEQDDGTEDQEDEDNVLTSEGKAKSKEETKAKSKAKPKASAQRRPGFDIDQGQTVFVRNVPFDATAEDLKEVFRRFGRVSSIKMVADKTGQNAHRGSAFVKFSEVAGAEAALATEEEANQKLKELSSVIKRSEQRELPAVEGFGISLKGRRLVLKSAVKPEEASELSDKTKPQKGVAAKERRSWMHLLNVGDITENSQKWENLSKSEQRQRQEGRKERKWRINNPNFAIHPQRLSIRNLPTFVDANKLRSAVVKNLVQTSSEANKKEGMKLAQQAIVKAILVRDTERRGEDGESRSKGYGFIAFKDHDSAMRTLEFLNDNPKVFGGNRRPIVEFAVEDKRKLRMQEEEKQKFEKKLAQKQQEKGTHGEGDKAEGEEMQPTKKTKKRKRPKLAESDGEKKKGRGAKQREKRRAQKAAAEERAKAKNQKQQMRAQMQEVAKTERQLNRKKRPRQLPDADPNPAKVKRRGELQDDFELRALERFRRGGKM